MTAGLPPIYNRFMSLKKKILLSFIISSSLIAALVVFEFINYTELKKEMRFLELTDSIRTKTLQLRRHEKNFFLYSPQKADEESAAIKDYISQLNKIIGENITADSSGRLAVMQVSLDSYGKRFERIKGHINDLSSELELEKAANKDAQLFQLVELTFLERPLEGANFLQSAFKMDAEAPLVQGLKDLDSDIGELRRSGEELIGISKDLDQMARLRAEGLVYDSQSAIIIFFPLFLLVGLGMLFYVMNNITSRLRILGEVVEEAGRGKYARLSVNGAHDEVGVLIEKFNDMEEQLRQREEELARKNGELMQAKKLASLGTLASGVAHELNNPLNNIYISAQVLVRQTKDETSDAVKEIVNDIMGQTARVKRIVGDLLEFARGKEPEYRRFDLGVLIEEVYKIIKTTVTYGSEDVKFIMERGAEPVIIEADPDQVERIFINLFTNAIDAMSGKGELKARIEEKGASVVVTVSDSGKGIKKESLDKIFEPFYTTKDKGTGLGLPIIFNIIKRHRGEITVESREGEGTAFTITLPKGKA